MLVVSAPMELAAAPERFTSPLFGVGVKSAAVATGIHPLLPPLLFFFKLERVDATAASAS